MAFFVLPAFAVSERQAAVFDLGAPSFSTAGRPGGVRFYATGNIYPAGTYTPQPGQPLPRGTCDSADDVHRVGYYVIYGESGNAGKHTATYRIVISGKIRYFSGTVESNDELGAPVSTLFELARIEGGQLIVDDPAEFAEFTPRSSNCFGGQIKLFLN